VRSSSNAMTARIEPRRPPAVTQTSTLLASAALAALACTPALAAGVSAAAIDWFNMGITLLGGLALFLFGMDQMAEALKAVAGERMKILLARLTTNRFMGALTGAFVTAVVNSSSVTTVLVVGFITAGLMSMSQSVGIIMGANIGSTITAQLIAFRITNTALLMVAGGFGLQFLSRWERIRQYGSMLMGLGLVFFGMGIMSEAMGPLRSYAPFLDLMAHMENPLVAILIAAVFTGLVQSSAATTGIVIVMASQGFITLQAGIALAFGANIGTCVTAMLATIGKPREAVRAAMVHILFNVFGVLLWYNFIPQLAEFVTWLSPSHPGLSGAARLAAEAPRQIANAHTTFNVANTFIFIGFSSQFARLVEWLIPDKPLVPEIVIRPKYLDEELLETPSLALGRVRLEFGHVGGRVIEMLERILPAILTGDRMALKAVTRIDDDVDILHGHIVTYLGRISQKALTEQQTRELVHLMDATNNLENIGDIVETDLASLGERRIEQRVSISEATQAMLRKLHNVVMATVELAIDAVAENDRHSAQEIIAMKSDIARLTDSAAMHETRRLVAEEPNRLAAYTVEMDVIEKLKRIYYHAKRMAKDVLPEEEKPVEEQAA
jgi:phosphate:Na+ symporter